MTTPEAIALLTGPLDLASAEIVVGVALLLLLASYGLTLALAWRSRRTYARIVARRMRS